MVIKREVIIGNCRLLLGDCLEIMPTLGAIDLIISDPPYGTENGIGYGRGHAKIANDKNLDVVDAALRKIGAMWHRYWCVLFHSPRNAPEFYEMTRWLTYRGCLVWDKKAPGMGGALRYQHEMVSVFSSGAPDEMRPLFSVLQHYRDAEQHPHQKPIELMRQLVNCFPGNFILDPFMGSGSTGVACAKLGRTFTGIEIDPDYFEIACKRIRDAYKQPDLFVDAPAPQPVQETLI